MAFGQPKLGVTIYNLLAIVAGIALASTDIGWARGCGWAIVVLGVLIGFMMGSWWIFLPKQKPQVHTPGKEDDDD